jgi:hypothetical protein
LPRLQASFHFASARIFSNLYFLHEDTTIILINVLLPSGAKCYYQGFDLSFSLEGCKHVSGDAGHLIISIFIHSVLEHLKSC